MAQIGNTIRSTLSAGLERRIGGPVGFRAFLERRGGTFIKIGQFLALRPDLIPPEYCQELLRLFERVPPFSWLEARQIIKEDLGAEPAELFGYIDATPLAAGSLAQTHYARLPSGREVAIKVLRPDARERVLRDLRHARRLARLIELSGASFILSPREAVEEISNWLMRELDLEQELANMRRLRGLTAESSFQVVPRPYPDYCGRRVLTAEYIRGVHFTDLLQPPGAQHGGETDATEVDRDLLAERLIKASLIQMLRYRFFHADLHPGNLIAQSRGRIAFVDFGLCEEVDETFRRRQLRYLGALYRGDNEQVFRSLLEILVPTENADPEGLRNDFFAAVRARLDEQRTKETIRLSDRTYSSPIANYLVAVMRAARLNGYQVPVRILAMYRALLTAELVAHQLGSSADLRSVGRELIGKLQSDEMLQGFDSESLEPTLLSYFSLWRDYPGQVSQILTDLADNRFVLKAEVAENAELRQNRNRRARAIVTSIITIGVAILIAFPGFPKESEWITWLLVAALLLLYLVTYLQYRRLR
jgi:ubiquinone biosynthesis protein